MIVRSGCSRGWTSRSERRPQDSRFKTSFQDEIELRVSTIPTVFGEKVVARVSFDPGAQAADLENLGFFPREAASYRGMLAQTSGLILVVGPTRAERRPRCTPRLSHLQSPRVNIPAVTLEDPIEMVHETLSQIAMQPGFRAHLRDPALRNVLAKAFDVVMVGEIQDEETAQNAVQAALTGHLVISTIHTIDAASAVGHALDLENALPAENRCSSAWLRSASFGRSPPHCAVDDVTRRRSPHLRIQCAGRQLQVRRGVGCVEVPVHGLPRANRAA